MSPPIDIDGSEIQEATIDGQNVSEITIDGQQAARLRDIPDSGVARLTFDNADTSGSTAVDVWNSNDATINGATTGVSGQFNEAFDFDGTDDYVSTPVAVPSGDFSVAVWFDANTANLGSFTSVLSTRNEDGDGSNIEINANNNPDNIGARINNNEIGAVSPIPSGFNLYVLTFDGGGGAEFYHNDSSAGTSSGISHPDDSTTVDIGRRPAGDNHTAGVIDQPDVYSKELSSAEVSNLYNTGSIGG